MNAGSQHMDQPRLAMPWHRWQDWVSLVLGIWLFIAPWVWGSSSHLSGHEYASAWDSWIMGVVFVVFAVCALSDPKAAWAEWVNTIGSVWLFIAPWAIGFAATGHSAAWNSWIVAIIVFVVSIWSATQIGSKTGTGGMATGA